MAVEKLKFGGCVDTSQEEEIVATQIRNPWAGSDNKARLVNRTIH